MNRVVVQELMNVVTGPPPANSDPQPLRVALFSLGNMANHSGLHAELTRLHCKESVACLAATSRDPVVQKYSDRIATKLKAVADYP